MPPPAVPKISAKEFLLTLWGDAKGIAELTIIGSKLQKKGFKAAYPFSYPESIDSYLSSAANHNRTDNVYMGVCLRREKWASNSRGTEALALSAGAIWAEFDFAEHGHKGKTIPEAEARKVLYEFPRKPSIINRSGGGIQCFWLLKELVFGQDLWHLKAINRALAKFFNADTQSVDLARVLRIPWSKNWNYEPVRTVEIAWWHPEFRYRLDDFDFLPIEEERRVMGLPAQPKPPAPPVAVSQGSPAPAAAPVPLPVPALPSPLPGEPTPSESFKAAAESPEGLVLETIPTPTTELTDETIAELGKLVAALWVEGLRHELALCIAGWFMKVGVKEESTRKVIELASKNNLGDTKKRLKDVEDTYKNRNIKTIKGKGTLDESIEKMAPEGKIRTAYQSLVKSINAKLPRMKGHKRPEQEMDFKILHLTKFNSIPAGWTVVIEKDLEQYTTTLENSRFSKFESFVDDVLEQNSVALTAALKKHEWMAKIHEAIENGLYEEKEAPTDARPGGAIENGLQEFLAESRENPEVGLLKKFAGHDDDTSFFLPNTFKTFLEDQGNKFSPHKISEKLKDMGWQKKPRRFGKKVPQVWIKAIVKGGSGNGNGNGNGNGHPKDGNGAPPMVLPDPSEESHQPETVPPKNPGDPPSGVDLFPKESSDE